MTMLDPAALLKVLGAGMNTFFLGGDFSACISLIVVFSLSVLCL